MSLATIMRFSALALLPLVFLAFTSVSLGAPSRRRTLSDSTTTEASSSTGTTGAALPSLAPSLLSQTNDTPTSSSFAVFTMPSSAPAASTTDAEGSSPKRIKYDELPINFDSESITRLVVELSGQSFRGATQIFQAIKDRDGGFFCRKVECPICSEFLHADTSVTIACNHSFHKKCLFLCILFKRMDRHLLGAFECPLCRTKNKFDDISDATALQKSLENFEEVRLIPTKPEGDFSGPVATFVAICVLNDVINGWALGMLDEISNLKQPNFSKNLSQPERLMLELLVDFEQAAQDVVSANVQIPELPDVAQLEPGDLQCWLRELTNIVHGDLSNILRLTGLETSLNDWKKRKRMMENLSVKLSVVIGTSNLPTAN